MEELELLHQIRHLDAVYRRKKHLTSQKLYPADRERTQGYGRILSSLSESAEGMSQKDLAEKLSIRPQSLTEALENLDKEELIVRKRSKTDKRQVLVSISEKGLEAEKHNRQIRRLVSEEIFACLNETEKKELRRLLEKINSEADRNQKGEEP